MIGEFMLLLAQGFIVIATLMILGLVSSPVGGLDKKKFFEQKKSLDGNLSETSLTFWQRISLYFRRYFYIYLLYRWDLSILMCLILSAFFYILYLALR